MSFEYVISGLGYTRILLSAFRDNPELVELCNEIVNERNSQNKTQVSVLFNGLIETTSGESLKKYPSFKNVFVDSGGLQAITRGLVVDEEFKKGVYAQQAQYGTVGMCFDEIPLKVIDYGSAASNKKNRTTTKNKVFQDSLVEEKAIHTGNNVKQQLQYFADVGTKCKAMAIAQGNCQDSMVRYLETLFKQIPDELKDGIHGIALADTCIGNGILETIKMCHALEIADIDPKFKKHIHFLGVGSIQRSIPILALHQNLFKDKVISFDSTTHSMGWMFGKRYTDRGQIVQLGQNVSDDNKKIFKGIYSKYVTRLKDVPDEIEYLKYVYQHIMTFSHLNTEHPIQAAANLSAFAYCFRAVDVYCRIIEDIIDNPSNIYNYVNGKGKRGGKMHTMTSTIMSLSQINNKDDFDSWFKENGKRVDSKSIITDKQVDTVTLQDLIA